MAPHDIPREKLLITGVSGYVGFKTLLISLSRGYAIRALVRKDSHVTDLQNHSAAVAAALKSGQLEVAIVPDFLDQETIYTALQGITVIIHIASPLAVQTEKYQEEIIQPAISMVTTFLEAAARVPTVRRVVVTSSMVTLIPFEWNANPDSERLYNTTDLNTTISTPPTSPMHAYWISKALARLATRNFIETHAPHFDYVNILAGVIIGPDDRLIPSPTNNPTTADLLVGTRASIFAPLLGKGSSAPFPYVDVPVHVADVAKAHVDAVDSTRVPGNSEFILASDATRGGVVWERDARAVARKYFAKEVESGVFPMEGSLETIRWRVDTGETERVFGWEHVGFEETMRGLVEQYLEIRGLERGE
ncbi:NAD(P)-binding protein [Aspergillus germanicus]